VKTYQTPYFGAEFCISWMLYIVCHLPVMSAIGFS